MNKNKIMAILLSSLIAVNQLTTVANATTLVEDILDNENIQQEVIDDEKSGNVSENQGEDSNSSSNDDKNNTEDNILKDEVVNEEEFSSEIKDEILEDEIADTQEVQGELVPIEAWEDNSVLIDEVLDRLGKTDILEVTYEELKEVKVIDLSFTYSGVPEILKEFTGLVYLGLAGAMEIGGDYENVFNIISQLTSLKELDLSYSEIYEIPNSISNLVNLNSLYLSGNYIGEIPTSILSLENLEYLEMAQCGIDDIPNDIDKLSSLISLELAYNNISSVPKSIGDMTSLRYLGIESNNFYEFPTEVCKLTKLEDLVLRNNFLVSVPDISMFNGDKINFNLDVSGNQIYSLPQTTTQNIVAYNNFISTEYAGMPYNAQLKMNGNWVNLGIGEEVSEDIFNQFVYVYKIENIIEGRYEELDSRLSVDFIYDGKVLTVDEISNLEEGVYKGKLKIRGSEEGNKAAETQTFTIVIGGAEYEEEDSNIVIPEDATGVIPYEYWEDCLPLMNATYVALGGEKSISEITFEDLSNVSMLIMMNQDLDDLPTLVTKFTNLQYLTLEGNRFNEIPMELFKLENLLELDLSANMIEYIPEEITNFKKLTYLALSNSWGIQESLDYVFELTNLEFLILNNCNLNEISDKINNLTNLYYLDIGDNQLTSLDFNVEYVLAERNIFYDEYGVYKQLVLTSDEITISKENLNDKEYLNSLVKLQMMNLDNGEEEYYINLNIEHELEFIIDGKVVTAEELSNYSDGTYEAKIKIKSADISNSCAITEGTVRIIIGEGGGEIVPPVDPVPPVEPVPPADPAPPVDPSNPTTNTGTNNNGNSSNTTLPKTGSMAQIGLVISSVLSLVGGTKLLKRKIQD